MIPAMPKREWVPFLPLFPSLNKGRQARLMLQAYFDDSASANQKGIVCLAGFVASDVNCQALAHDWFRLTQKHSIKRLHTSDFLSGKGEYEQMVADGLTFDKRIAIIGEFVFLFRKYVQAMIAVGVDIPAYQLAFAAYGKKFNPVEFCFYRIIRNSIEASQLWEPAAMPLSIAFDDSRESPKFLSAIRSLKQNRREVRKAVGAISFVDNRWVQPMQAADMFACFAVREFRKPESEAWKDLPQRDMLFTLEDPSRGIPGASELWDEPHLLAAGYEVASGLKEEKSIVP